MTTRCWACKATNEDPSMMVHQAGVGWSCADVDACRARRRGACKDCNARRAAAVDAAPFGTPVKMHDGLSGVVGDSAQTEGVVRVQVDGDPPGCLRDYVTKNVTLVFVAKDCKEEDHALCESFICGCKCHE